jgi:hypothetical protein
MTAGTRPIWSRRSTSTRGAITNASRTESTTGRKTSRPTYSAPNTTAPTARVIKPEREGVCGGETSVWTGAGTGTSGMEDDPDGRTGATRFFNARGR